MRETNSTKRRRMVDVSERVEDDDDDGQEDGNTADPSSLTHPGVLHFHVGQAVKIDVDNLLYPGTILGLSNSPLSIEVAVAQHGQNIPRGRIWLENDVNHYRGTFEVGQRVVANWQDGGVLYAGEITNVDAEHRTVDIEYDDEDIEKNVPFERVRDEGLVRNSSPVDVEMLLPPYDGDLHEGDEIHVEIDDQLVMATIMVVNPVSASVPVMTVDVLYFLHEENMCLGRIWNADDDGDDDDDDDEKDDDDDDDDDGNTGEDIGSKKYIDNTIYKVGQRVVGNYENEDILYPGVVSVVHEEDDTVDITYDDGDVELHVPKHRVRDERYAKGLVQTIGMTVGIPSPFGDGAGLSLSANGVEVGETGDLNGFIEHAILSGMRDLLQRMEADPSQRKTEALKVRNDIASFLMQSKHHQAEAIPFILNTMLPRAIEADDDSYMAVAGMYLEKLGDNALALGAYNKVLDVRQGRCVANNYGNDEEIHRLIDAHIHMSRALTNLDRGEESKSYCRQGMALANRMTNLLHVRAMLKFNVATAFVGGSSSLVDPEIGEIVDQVKTSIKDLGVGKNDEDDVTEVKDAFLAMHRSLLGMGRHCPSRVSSLNLSRAAAVADDFVAWATSTGGGEHCPRVIRALIVIGNGLGIAGCYSDAIIYLRRALNLVELQTEAERKNDLHGGPHVYYMLAKNLWFAGQKDESKALLGKSRAMCVERGIADEAQGIGKWSKDDLDGFGERSYVLVEE